MSSIQHARMTVVVIADHHASSIIAVVIRR
jgi:hypothetical protein